VGDTRVTTHPSLDRHPTWSPDGRRIAFASDRDGVSQVYVIGRDGTGLRRLTDDPQGAMQPDWHPSEARLLYSVWQAGGVADIFTVDVDSGRVRNVSDTALEWESAPAWSPDGKQIAALWSEFPNAAAAVAGIAIMRDDGGHVAEFGRRGVWLGSPSWSPDGRRLALLRHPVARGHGLAIFVLDMDGDELHRLTEALNDRWPSWSPDGREIAFTTYRDGDSEIYSITTASKVARRVTHRPGSDYEAAWSPLGLAVESPSRR
jgi:TolB protein